MFSLILYWTLYVFILFCGSYIQKKNIHTHNKRRIFCGFCAVVMLNSQQKKGKTAPINRNSAQGQTAGLIAQGQGAFPAPAPPQLQGNIQVVSINDDVCIINEHMLICFV